MMSQKRQLGNSDLQITAIGIGAWAMGGGDWAFGWGAQDDNDSIDAIHAAIDAGLNWIDTAAVYGLGHAEEVVGKAVATASTRPYVFTKCARVWDESRKIGKCIKADSVVRECEASLLRLGLDVIDLYQMHWPEPDEDIEEGWTAMTRLREQGKVRWCGVSNYSVAQMKRVAPIAPITSLQPPYSLVSPEVGAEILPHALANNIGVIVYSPMKAGLLSGAMTRERALALGADDWRSRNPAFQEPQLTANLAIVDRLRAVGDAHGRTPGEAAIAWTLANPAVTGAIVGMRNRKQVAGVAGALDFRLTAAEKAQIEGA